MICKLAGRSTWALSVDHVEPSYMQAMCPLVLYRVSPLNLIGAHGVGEWVPCGFVLSRHSATFPSEIVSPVSFIVSGERTGGHSGLSLNSLHSHIHPAS